MNKLKLVLFKLLVNVMGLPDNRLWAFRLFEFILGRKLLNHSSTLRYIGFVFYFKCLENLTNRLASKEGITGTKKALGSAGYT
jgi:hypothetical protein